jgi:hypothetical protein
MRSEISESVDTKLTPHNLLLHGKQMWLNPQSMRLVTTRGKSALLMI